MSNERVYAGNKGDNVREDCYISLELKKSGGLHVEIQSKTPNDSIESLENLALEMLHFFEIEHASMNIEDRRALPLVIAARIEAAIKKLKNTKKEYLFPLSQEKIPGSAKDHFRFSQLYVPGNTPGMMMKAGKYLPNSIIFDLEDSVSVSKKMEARFLVRNVLRGFYFGGAERMVRINSLDRGLEDLQYIVPHGVHVIVLPKCEKAADVRKVNDEVQKIKTEKNMEADIFLMPVIESAMGVENAYDIVRASDNVIALAIGLEDYTADIGTKRTNTGTESFFARSRIVNACKAAGKQAIDSVFSDIGDQDGFRKTVKQSRTLGFDGIGCIHPTQIEIAHNDFAPAQEEISEAIKIVKAFENADKHDQGVFSLDQKMIDPPVVKRAKKIINVALHLGMISQNWRQEHE